ncbi:MAG: hypothetical protein V7746_20625 [Halioglobus sp.]
MKKFRLATLTIGFACGFVFLLYPAAAHSSAEPGATVRNVFGPGVGVGANQCRGACGGGCPRSCGVRANFECAGDTKLRRVQTFTCGTNLGCREHDDCLDNCLLNEPQSPDCQRQCDTAVVEQYGFENATPWLLGKGPYDGQITFEYTRHGPAELEPAYRCPAGSNRQCDGGYICIGPHGHSIVPVFDSYPAAKAGAMQVSQLRAGPFCKNGDNRVCENSDTIRIVGDARCSGGACTRFGIEFDYRNGDPTAPLKCSSSTRGGDGDFIGDLIKLGGDATASRDAATGGPKQDDGMAQLLGLFGKVIASADSPEDLQVSMTTLDEHGNPDESKRVGSGVGDAPAPIPSSVELPAGSGHLIVPMFQLAANSKSGTAKERRITCTHKGEPVLETVFVLQH